MDSLALHNPWIMGMLMLILGVLAGYATGRRLGHREGVALGLAFAPLNLRKEAWEQGECTICGTKCDDTGNSAGVTPESAEDASGVGTTIVEPEAGLAQGEQTGRASP